MIEKLRNPYLPSVAVFVVFIFGITIANIITPAKDVSVLERRELAQRPQFTMGAVISGDYAEGYADYMQDQAAFRDGVRYLKSFTERQVLRKLENNGVYVLDDFVYDKFYGIDHQRAAGHARRMNEIIEEVGISDVYLAVIPTKASGLGDDRYLLSDQREIAELLRDGVDAAYIDLMEFALTETEIRYYGSDPHWTTRGALEAYWTLATGLGLRPVDGYSFEVSTDEYVGSEYGRASAWSVPLDSIELAHGGGIDALTSCRTVGVETEECFDSVYVPTSDATVDLYDVFLGGLAPLIEITNPDALTDQDLVIFKDSYAHALAPFLAQHYRTVTLIDLRYIQREYALTQVDFSNATVLFLYSTSVINTDARALN